MWEYKLFSAGVLIISGVLGLASKSLLGCWFFLEFSSVAFMGLALGLKAQVKDLISYFMVQGVGSAGLVLGVVLWHESGALVILLFCLLLKLGAAPFHLWLVTLLSRVPWSVFFVMSVWQKVLPLIILQSVVWGSAFLGSLGVLSALAGSLFMLKSWDARVVLSGSSVYTLGWLMVVPFHSVAFLLLLWGYSAGLAGLAAESPGQDLGGWINLSGLPPFSLFWGKLGALVMLLGSSLILGLVMLNVAVLSMYCYLRFLIKGTLLPPTKAGSAKTVIWGALGALPGLVLLGAVH